MQNILEKKTQSYVSDNEPGYDTWSNQEQEYEKKDSGKKRKAKVYDETKLEKQIAYYLVLLNFL